MSLTDTNFNIDSIYFFSCSRKRRATDSLEFRAEHIIIISIEENSVKEETTIEIFVLDPRSTSLLPAKAFTPEDLKTVILEMKDSGDLPYPLESVVNPNPPTRTTGGPADEDGDGSNVPVIGAVAGVVVLIALVLTVWFYRRRRKNKRYIFLM